MSRNDPGNTARSSIAPGLPVLVTLAEAANLFAEAGVQTTVRALTRYVRQGRLAAVYIGRKYLTDREAVRRFLSPVPTPRSEGGPPSG
jgi:hypothetical protein